MATSRCLTYLGTIDDVVQRYPWKFRVDESYLQYTLICHMFRGSKLLINDGYLINNEIARKQFFDKNSLLRRMIRAGAISVLTRGYRYNSSSSGNIRIFGIDEMPEKMQHVGSIRDLVNNRIAGIPSWGDIKKDLNEIDQELVTCDGYVPWAPYETGSGYVAFVEKLLGQGSNPKSVGLGALISTNAFNHFLETYRQDRARSTMSPRDQWEYLSQQYANNPNYTDRPHALKHGLMRLANEIYHYNFGVGLAVSFGVPVAVETQPSKAFDDLLIEKDVLVERLSDVPLLHIPKGIVAVPAQKLVSVMNESSDLGAARKAYVEALRPTETSKTISVYQQRSIKAAERRYSQEIAHAFKNDINIGLAGSAFETIISEGTSLLGGAGAALATYVQTGDATVSSIAAAATKVGITFFVKEAVKPVLVERFRLLAAPSLFSRPNAVRKSQRAIKQIYNQRSPISLVIEPESAVRLTEKMKKF